MSLFNELIGGLEKFTDPERSHTAFLDKKKSDLNKGVLIYKDGFANTEYFAWKKTIVEAARFFLKNKEADKVNISIPAKGSVNVFDEEERICHCEISRSKFEKYFNLNLSELDQQGFQEKFINSKDYKKEDILRFAKKFIKSTARK